MTINKKRVLITGGLGYLGRRIARALVQNRELNVRLGDIMDVQKSVELCEYIPMNLLSDVDLKKVCEDVDIIVHLAALNEVQCQDDPERALLVNGIGTYKLLQAAIQQGVRRIIFFSTIHVYGSPLAGKITEKNVTRPAHPYAFSKRLGEDLLLSADDQEMIEGVVFRLSNGLGAPIDRKTDRWKLVCNDLCRQAVSDKKLTLKSSGLQWRDFITISDITRAVEHFMAIDTNSLSDGLFNLGGKNSLRIIDFAQRVAQRCKVVLGFLPEILVSTCQNNTIGDFTPLEYRIDKIENTGFALVGSMDDEIDDTLRFMATH